MKRKLLLLLLVIVGIVLVFVSCVRFMIENSVIESLPGEIDSISFFDSTWQDYTEFEKHTFEDSVKLRNKLANHKFFKPVKTEDIDYLAGFFEDFEGWIEDDYIYSEYDIDVNCIDEEDYYYMEKEETDIYDGYKWYIYYDLYYFDVQSMQAYFIHNNI